MEDQKPSCPSIPEKSLSNALAWAACHVRTWLLYSTRSGPDQGKKNLPPDRQGVRLLQVVQLLYAIYSLALGIFICTTIDKDPTTKGGAIQALANTRFGKTDSSVRVFAYILTGLLALEVTVVLVGIYSVVKRIVGDFKFFAYAGIFLSIIELGFSIGRGFYVLRELPVVFAAVCFYLYRPYINTMKVENAEIEDEAAVVVATLVAARAVVAAEAGERPNVAVATVST